MCAGGDARLDASGQGFVAGAPYVLLFVSDGKMLTDLDPRAVKDGWDKVLVGAMTQNLFLAAESLGISGRYMASMKEDAVREALKLDKADTPVCIVPLGKK